MSERRVKDALLERYLAQDLAPPARARIEAALNDSPEDRARLDELRADTRAFLLAHPPGQLVAFLERRSTGPRWPALLAPLVGAACAAAFALAVGPAATFRDGPPTSIKGAVVLMVHKKTERGSEPIGPGQVVAPGDAIRFEVRAPHRGFAAMLGHDGRGHVTVHHPFEGTEAAPYDPSEPVLPTAIELDDAPGAERLFAVWSRRPFRLAPLVEAIARSGRLDGKGAVKVDSVLLEKRR